MGELTLSKDFYKKKEKHKYESEWYNLRPILGNAN